MSTASQERINAGHSLRILDSKSALDKEVLASLELPDIDEFINNDWRRTFEELLRLLDVNGIPYTRNKSLVRGLDYYNGTCFEVVQSFNDAEQRKAQSTLLAGGRYDYLA